MPETTTNPEEQGASPKDLAELIRLIITRIDRLTKHQDAILGVLEDHKANIKRLERNITNAQETSNNPNP